VKLEGRRWVADMLVLWSGSKIASRRPSNRWWDVARLADRWAVSLRNSAP